MAVAGITFPQGPELILILAVLVLLFGAKKLPELGSSVGRTITNFKKGVAEGQEEEDGVDEENGDEPVESASPEDRDSSGS